MSAIAYLLSYFRKGDSKVYIKNSHNANRLDAAWKEVDSDYKPSGRPRRWRTQFWNTLKENVFTKYFPFLGDFFLSCSLVFFLTIWSLIHTIVSLSTFCFSLFFNLLKIFPVLKKQENFEQPIYLNFIT